MIFLRMQAAWRQVNKSLRSGVGNGGNFYCLDDVAVGSMMKMMVVLVVVQSVWLARSRYT